MSKPTFAEQRAYYNRLWETVGAAELNSHESARLQRIRAELDARFPTGHPPLRLLEIGCGRGWLSGLVLAEHGVVRALDLSDESIAKARARFPAIDFETGNVFDLRLDAYDVVVASEVIEHIDDKPRFVDVLARVVKPGGYVILTTPNARHFDRWKKTAPFQQPIEEWVTPKQLRQLLEVDFDVSTSTTFFFYIGPGLLDRALTNRVSRLVRRRGWVVDEMLGRLGLGLYSVTVGQHR